MSEQQFTRELERRVEHVHGARLTLDTVRGKARTIRRRRRIAAGTAAAAAVAAIAIPFAVIGTGGGSGPEPAPSPTPSPSVEEPQTPGSSVLHDGLLTHPDGSVTPLDVDTTDLQQFGVLTDGRVVVAVPGQHLVRVYGPAGGLLAEYHVALNVITMSADDTLVAWIDDNLRAVVLESGRPEPTTFEWGVPMPGEAYGSIDAVYGSDCAHDGCTLLVGDFSTTTDMLEKVSEPAVPLETSEPERVAAVSADGQEWAVTFPPGETEQFGCSGLYDRTTDTVTQRNCDTTLWSWSPDGAHLVGARGDNGMWGSVEVLDRNLEVTLDYQPDHGLVVKDWGWADAEHLWVVVAGLDADPQWSLLRVPIDGTEPEVVTGPLPGPNPELGTVFAVSD